MSRGSGGAAPPPWAGSGFLSRFRVGRGELTGIYRREGEWNLVELNLSNPDQLFNSLDPSPFRERDLDTETAEYIVDAMRELRGHHRVKLVFHLQGPCEERTRQQIPDAIKHYFGYREMTARLTLRQVLRQGRTTLAVGLVFLAICTTLWAFVFTGQGVASRLLHEGVLIMGWVAMWRPLDVLLYDWWPLLADARLFGRISRLPVEIRWPAQ